MASTILTDRETFHGKMIEQRIKERYKDFFETMEREIKEEYQQILDTEGFEEDVERIEITPNIKLYTKDRLSKY